MGKLRKSATADDPRQDRHLMAATHTLLAPLAADQDAIAMNPVLVQAQARRLAGLDLTRELVAEGRSWPTIHDAVASFMGGES